MKIRLQISAIASFFLLFSGHAWGQTYPTNVDGVILKNVECLGSLIVLNISNRSNQRITGTLVVTIFDGDGDPIDNGRKGFAVGPVSGEATSIRVGCDSASKYTFRIE